jgi:hypothetical protein
MWESRVLCEISKPRWKSFCDFHGGGISTAVGAGVSEKRSRGSKLDGTSGRRSRDRIRRPGIGFAGSAMIRAVLSDHRARSFDAFVSRGLRRGRYDSPSMIKS